MKHFYNLIQGLFFFIALTLAIQLTAQDPCTTPVITSIGNNGPVCEGGTLQLSATGTVNGVSSGFIKMAGIGANAGNRSFDQVFAYGDRPGSIDRISNEQFDAIFAGQPTNAARAAALKAKYDVLMFTWASPDDPNITWDLIKEYLNTGGSVFVDGDYNNVDNLYDGTASSVRGFADATSGGCGYTIVTPAPFPTLVANGVTGCFANDHLSVLSFPSWMQAYIKVGSKNLAVAGIYPSGNHGRLIVQGPDQDYHSDRNDPPGSIERNQYQFILNQLDFLTANQAGFTWTGPNGFSSNEQNPIIANITAANAGVYTAKLTNTTEGGCFTTATTTVIVNLAPTVTSSNVAVPAATGSCSAAVNYSPTITGSPTSISYELSGATTGSGNGTGSGSAFNIGVTNVKITVSNSCGSNEGTFTVTVTDEEDPAIVDLPNNITRSNDNGQCGSVVSWTEPAASDNCTGVSLAQIAGPANGSNFPIGITTVTYKATDAVGRSSTRSFTVTINDTELPVITHNGNKNVNNEVGKCGASVAISASATDNCSVGTPSGTRSDGKPLTDDYPAGTTTITWNVSDANSNAALPVIQTVTVNNTAPVITSLTASTSPISIGTPVNLTIAYTDNNASTAVIDWEGVTQNASISTNPLVVPHTYSDAGVYTVKATVNDMCNSASSTSIFEYVVVYDPNGAFTTGGGWINSLPGSYTADPTLGGKANFGFVSKYQKGATIPSGNTEFQFHVGNLNFNSTVYEWLVVSGAKAQFKGSGTINGIGNYGFLVSVVDGQVTGGGGVDKFRIKIWNKATGVVVYDNQLGSPDDAEATTAIAGGTIVIQAAKAGKTEVNGTAKDNVVDVPLAINLKVDAMPNPSRSYFNVVLQGNASKTVNLKVIDMLGRKVEVRRNISANGTLRLGDNYRPGIYLVEVQQGTERITLKLIKGVN